MYFIILKNKATVALSKCDMQEILHDEELSFDGGSKNTDHEGCQESSCDSEASSESSSKDDGDETDSSSNSNDEHEQADYDHNDKENYKAPFPYAHYTNNLPLSTTLPKSSVTSTFTTELPSRPRKRETTKELEWE